MATLRSGTSRELLTACEKLPGEYPTIGRSISRLASPNGGGIAPPSPAGRHAQIGEVVPVKERRFVSRNFDEEYAHVGIFELQVMMMLLLQR